MADRAHVLDRGRVALESSGPSCSMTSGPLHSHLTPRPGKSVRATLCRPASTGRAARTARALDRSSELARGRHWRLGEATRAHSWGVVCPKRSKLRSEGVIVERDSPVGWAALFWHAFDRSANPMALLRADRVLVAVNPALVKDLGYPPNEVVGRRSDLFVAPEWAARLERDWARLLRAGGLTAERGLVCADGRHVTVQFAAHSVLIDGRQLVLYVVLDIKLRPMQLGGGGSPQDSLTPRELQIVAEVAMGRRWHEIATDLHISQSTVKTHVRHAMQKLGARSQAQLVAIALTTGVLAPAQTRGGAAT